MKGIIFTALADMVIEEYGEDIWDEVLQVENLSTDGAYTAVGNYPANDIHLMVDKLSTLTNQKTQTIFSAFGNYVSDIFIDQYVVFYSMHNDLFPFLESIDSYIHKEVLKLYPDASLPTLKYQQDSQKKVHIVYESKNNMIYFAYGLIQGASKYYKQPVCIKHCVNNEITTLTIEKTNG